MNDYFSLQGIFQLQGIVRSLLLKYFIYLIRHKLDLILLEKGHFVSNGNHRALFVPIICDLCEFLDIILPIISERTISENDFIMFTNPQLPFYFTISTHVSLAFFSLIMIYYLEILLISWGDEKYSLRFYF